MGADYLIQKYNRLEMSRAVILQAASAAMIEEYCDQVCEGLKKNTKKKAFICGQGSVPDMGIFSKLPEECFKCPGCRKAPGDQTDRQFSDDAFQIRDSSDRSEQKAPPL